MKFKDRLLQGTFIKRYKRFFVDIKYKNKIITAHCPNSGSMMGLLKSDNNVWFSQSNNPFIDPEFGQCAVIVLFLYFISTKNLLYLLINRPCNNLTLNFIRY